MINNFGGGGTNVSRFFVYSPLFATGKSEILLNYYYLNTKFAKTPAFNTDILKDIMSFGDIRVFLEYARRQLIEVKRNCLEGKGYQPSSWRPLVLLDSGSGNIFRDILPRLSEKNFEEVFRTEIKDYINFCEKLRFDIAIGLDIAGKYTWKKGEMKNADYLARLEAFSEPKWNLMVNKMFLQGIPRKPVTAYYAAIHGKSPEEYLNYLNLVLSIEKEVNRRYFGFAIGNLGNASKSNIYKSVRLVRNRLNELNSYRPIHILGVGSIHKIIPLSVNGADTFDCQSPWRRASEDKLVIPLLDSNLEVIAKDETYWKYIHVDKIDEVECDCEVCRENSLSELRKLKDGTLEEKYYFRISAYKHNIHQQEMLCELARSNIDLNDLIDRLPKSKYKEEIRAFFVKENQKALV